MSSQEQTIPKGDGEHNLENVPLSSKKSTIGIFVLLLSFTILSTTMVAGAQLGYNFIFDDLVIILLVGTAILATYAGLMCWAGAKTGLSAFLLARMALGKSGAKWACLVLGGTQMAWYGVQTAYLGLVFSASLGLEAYFLPITLFWGIFTGLFAIKGTRGMEIVAWLSLPAFLFLAYIVPSLSIAEAGGFQALRAIQPLTQELTFIAGITAVVGTFISGATNTPNVARFIKAPRKGFLAGILAFGIGTLVMASSGMLAGLALQEGDMVVILLGLGIVFMAMIILIFNIWTTNTVTIYAVGVASTELFNKPNKTPFVICGIILGTLIGMLGIYNLIMPILILSGTFIPPLGGIIVGDLLCTWRKKLPTIHSMEFKTVRKANWIAYLIAVLIAYGSAQFGIGIPSINGVVSAIVLCYAINKVFAMRGIDDNHKIKENAEYVYINE